MYIHEHQNWPHLTWDQSKLAFLLAEVRYLQGRLLGRMETLGFQLQQEATLYSLTEGVVKTSEIEGEKLNNDQVRSSLARHLGIAIDAVLPVDRKVEGIVEVMLDATRNYDTALSKERLVSWHATLLPTGRSGLTQITVGDWRSDKSSSIQVISGAFTQEKIHDKAPSHERLNTEMSLFLKWLNAPSKTDLIIKSALAHFWFVTIHPFEDGNGHIARALADMLLARSEHSKQRFYSMSAQIQREHAAYYDILEQCRKGSLDITAWVEWFLHCLKRAITSSNQTHAVVLTRARFWQLHSEEIFNERQRNIINRLLNGMEGKLTSSKWAKLAECSQDTALRDINDLVERKILLKDNAGGRSTSYQVI